MRRTPLLVALLLVWLSGCIMHRTRAPAARPNPALEATPIDDVGRIRVYWVGHATVLVQMGDRFVLTDPVFENWVGIFLKRFVAAGIDIEGLPELDWVLISHGHVDHLSIPSLRRLGPNNVLGVPPGILTYLPSDLAFRRVAALNTWRSATHNGVTVTAVPARHGSGRYLVDGPWIRHGQTGWIIEYDGMTVYFAGDTGFHPEHFHRIGQRFDVDVALIPVGPIAKYPDGSLISKPHHANPTEALQIFAATGAKWMVPIHFGTFYVGASDRRDVRHAMEKVHQVHFLEAGQAASFFPQRPLVPARRVVAKTHGSSSPRAPRGSSD